MVTVNKWVWYSFVWVWLVIKKVWLTYCHKVMTFVKVILLGTFFIFNSCIIFRPPVKLDIFLIIWVSLKIDRHTFKQTDRQTCLTSKASPSSSSINATSFVSSFGIVGGDGGLVPIVKKDHSINTQ